MQKGRFIDGEDDRMGRSGRNREESEREGGKGDGMKEEGGGGTVSLMEGENRGKERSGRETREEQWGGQA